MKNFILSLAIILFFPLFGFSQFGVDFQYSNIPFFGFNYEIKNHWRPEVRLGTDTFFDNVSVEGIVTYDILNKEDYEFYAGLGARFNTLPGLVVPVGFNFYPFDKRNFGFSIELAPIMGEDNVLRGSFGLRYSFDKKKKQDNSGKG